MIWVIGHMMISAGVWYSLRTPGRGLPSDLVTAALAMGWPFLFAYVLVRAYRLTR